MTIEFRGKILFKLLLFTFVLLVSGAQAQELLTGLDENIHISETSKQVKTRALISIELPFVDDFSKLGQLVPNPKLWSNSQSIYINRTFAINPPTVGVATFDPFDSKGKIYDRASNSVFPADTLMSESIQLAYFPADSIGLSFYFQPQGYGDMPERADSLALEFYSPLDDIWNRVWSASVISNTEIEVSNHLINKKTVIQNDSIWAKFFRADIKIDDFRYLKDGFRFRFVNYASISIHPNFPGRSTSSDHWHLDFVYLDRNRFADNQNIPDIALTGEPKRLTTSYETVPATHFESAKSNLFDNPMTLELNYVNLGWGNKSVTRNFRLRSIYGASSSTLSYSAGAENISDGMTINLSYPIPNYEFSVTADSAAFELMSWIVTDNDPADFRAALRCNDTSRIVYEFKDCYAYDDGTAENGYGIFGSGSSKGKVAIKFRPYMADSLRGVYIYFNRAVNDMNTNHNFTVAVWNDAGGVPGEILHSETGGRPVFKDSLNKFVAYKFEKPVYLPEGEVFYVGWLQTDEGFLNIGFDRNRNSENNVFYNLGQVWEPSVFDGSLMFRPIFCRTGLKFPSDYEELEDNEKTGSRGFSDSFIAYPNPTRGIIYLEELDNTPINTSKIELYALSGELVKTFENVSRNIDLSNMIPGIYLMRVYNENKREWKVKRIIIAGQ
jgi:hypothetical protein